jgi:hypothetical protein
MVGKLNIIITLWRDDILPIIEAHNHRKMATVKEAVQSTFNIIEARRKDRNEFRLHPMLALFNNTDDEKLYITLLIQGCQDECGGNHVIIQDPDKDIISDNVHVLTPDVNFQRLLRLLCHVSTWKDIFILRCPKNPLVSAYYSSYMVACGRIGLRLFSVITFVDKDTTIELVA